MSVTAEDIKICGEALVLAGLDEIQSFEEGTRASRVASISYKTQLESFLQSHPWHFCTGQAQLSRLTDAPLFDYNYAYALPGDSIHLIGISILGQAYKIYGNKVYCNLDKVYVEYQFVPSNLALMPSYAREVLVHKLGSHFAKAVAGDTDLSEILRRDMNDLARTARALDSQAVPSSAIPDVNFETVSVR